MDTTMKDTEMAESIESSNNDSAHSYPLEFVAACERLNLRVADDHYQLWLAGHRMAAFGEGE